MTAKSYVVDGVVFRTQGSLESAISIHVLQAPINAPFVDHFLAAVVNTYHPEVIKAGQRATGLFRYLDAKEQMWLGYPNPDRIRGGKLMTAYFEPLNDWRDCTVFPWRGQRNVRSDIKAALRQKINESGLPRPKYTDHCARPGCTTRPLEYQHIDPTFDQIAEACLALMSPEEIETKFGYSKFVRGRDDVCSNLPDDHPAITFLLDSHTRNAWEWLCPYHHRNVAAYAPAAMQAALL